MITLLALFIGTSRADPPIDRIQAAEVERLSFQLHQYANRQAWNAVERTYLTAVATGAPLSAEDHQLGAHAARSRGDIGAVNTRLLAAFRADDTSEVLDELWAIAQQYGSVTLQGRSLVARKRPFDPVRAKALDTAIQALAADGSYTGLLPRGVYTLDGVEFLLLLGRPSVTLTTLPAPRKPRRSKP